MNTDARALALSATSKRYSAVGEWLPILFGLAVLYIPTFYDLATTLWKEEEHAHGSIVLAVVLWLVWQKRATLYDIDRELIEPATLAGSIVFGLGLVLYAIGRSQDIILFEAGSLAPVFAGVLLLTRGWAALRAFWFPLLFIAFLVPLPGAVVDAMTLPLKRSVSEIAEQLLYAAGYPIARSGVVLNIGQYQLLVADACSGLNAMFSLSALGLLYLYLSRYKSLVHNGIMLASILPIAFCANILRVVLLVLVTYHFGDAAAQGFLHDFSGMLLFVSALILLLGLDALLRLTARIFPTR